VIRTSFLWLALVVLLISCSSVDRTPTETTPASAPTVNETPALTPAPVTPSPTPTVADLDADPGEQQVLADLENLAIPIDSVDPNASSDDILSLVDLIGDATIVGLGEATHGTREFVTLRLQTIRAAHLRADRLIGVEHIRMAREGKPPLRLPERRFVARIGKDQLKVMILIDREDVQ
jgi:hypothetical protein